MRRKIASLVLTGLFLVSFQQDLIAGLFKNDVYESKEMEVSSGSSFFQSGTGGGSFFYPGDSGLLEDDPIGMPVDASAAVAVFIALLSILYIILKKGLAVMKKKLILFVTLACMYLWLPTVAIAQDTEFWFVAPDLEENILCGPGDSPMLFMITNGTAEPAHVTITLYNNGSPVTVNQTIAANSSYTYDIPTTNKGMIENPRPQAGTVTNYGVHIISDVKVTAYYHVLPPCTQDVFTLKGTAALGTLFYVPMLHDSYYYTGTGYPHAYDQIDIVASENNTVVKVVPKATISINGAAWTAGAGDTLVRTLNRGQTLKIMEHTPQYAANTPSLGGTYISASRPIAVTTTEDLIGRSATPATGWDMIGDQIVPVSSLGKQYVVVKGYMNGSERVYMVATEPNTTISVNNGSTTVTSPVLGAGGCWVFDMGNNGRTGGAPLVVTISASHPVYCYQVTGVGQSSGGGGDELGSALLPSVYSTSQKKISYFQHTSAASDYHYLFLLFRSGAESDFRITYDGITTTPSLTPLAVPGMSDWKAARFQTSNAMHNKIVTISNSQSIFTLGYFEMNVTGGGASFGYLSAFGALEFPDTTYMCNGAPVTLDAGYAASYEWTLPNGSKVTTPTVIASDTGKYVVVINQDPFVLTDTTRVLNRFEQSSLTSSPQFNVGAGTYTYTANHGLYSEQNVSYEWLIDGVTAGTGKTLTRTWSANDDKVITLVLKDNERNCTKTHTLVHNKQPDNVSDADCYTTAPSSQWDIKQIAKTQENVYWLATPFVGDMDSDGVPEVVVAGPAVANNSSDKILIFNADLQLVKTINTPVMPMYSAMTYLIADVDNDGVGEVVITGLDGTTGFLRCYKYTSSGAINDYMWTSENMAINSGTTGKFNIATSNYCPSLIVADIMGDNHRQILAVNKIFDAVTGKLLATLPTGGTGYSAAGPESYMPVFADMDNDGVQEIVAGNTIYKVNLTNYDSQTNTVTIWKQMPAGFPDGFTAVADIDLDGYLDVIVTGVGSANIAIMYAWNVKNGVATQLGSTVTLSNRRISRPFAGDIDGDGRPDVAFTWTNAIAAYKYNPGTNAFVQMWQKATSDSSGATTMTMFDFNQEGKVELVYRDETHLRIIDEFGNNISTFACSSATHTEYPVIADLDGDGHADIIVSGGEGGSGPIRLLRYGSVTQGAWAPARKVWNQHAYNAVNINEDLKVPRQPLNPSTVFPNGKRPYNGFLQQQTVLNKEGDPLWLAPKAQIIGDPTFSYNGTTLTVTLKVKNTGKASFAAPFKITVYKEVLGAGTKYTYSYNHPIDVNQEATITFDVPNILTWLPFGNLALRINDASANASDQTVCDEIQSDITKLMSVMVAANDYVIGIANNQITIPVLANDLTGSCAVASISKSISMSPEHGTGVFDGNQIAYTPASGFVGLDSLEYSITCSGKNSKAWAYIGVYSDGQRICEGSSGSYTIGIENPNDITVKWYDASNNLVTSITPNTSSSGKKNYAYTAKITFPARMNQPTHTGATGYVFDVVPLLMRWSATAANSNWNDPDNWNDPNGTAAHTVPLGCTTVHIPGHAAHFPSLDDTNTPRGIYGDPQCDQIIFHFGAEVAKPHYLTYNKAFVHYNFGVHDGSNHTQMDTHSSSLMARGRWYTLAAPLKNIVTGDFSFGGYPLTWQHGFRTSREPYPGAEPRGSWYAPSSKVDLEIGAEQYYAICLYVPAHDASKIGLHDHKHLHGLGGIIELPFFENGSQATYHPLHSHSGGTTTINYFAWADDGNFPILSGQFDSFIRGNEAYRFVFEDASRQPRFNFNVTVPAGDTVMIGNPFISSLDLATFLSDNSSNIESYCRVYANGTFEPHTSGLIHPLQGFFVITKGTKGNGNTVDLVFKASHSVTRSGAHELKSSEGDVKGAVKVRVSNRDGESFVTLVLNKGTEGKNVEWMFYDGKNPYVGNPARPNQAQPDHPGVPQLYSLDRKNIRNAIQYVGSDGATTDIPLGIRMRSTVAGSYRLSVEVPQDIAFESLTLFDRETGLKINMLSGGEYSFTANNFSDLESRFVLLVGKSATGIEEIKTQSSEITIYAVGNMLYVESPQQAIRSINVSSMQGIRMATIQGEGKNFLSKELYLAPGVYVVTITTESGKIFNMLLK